MSDAVFSASMVECAADGTNSALQITRPQKVTFDGNGFALGPQRFAYADLMDVAVSGNLLSLALRDKGGRRSERQFRYDTFLPGTGAKRLAELAGRLQGRLAFAAPAAGQPPTVRAEHLSDGPKYTVRVYGTHLAFPPVCPVCSAPASRPAELAVSSGR